MGTASNTTIICCLCNLFCSVSCQYSFLIIINFFYQNLDSELGSSDKWVTQEGVIGNGPVDDPPIERDAAARLRRHHVFRSVQAVFSDLSWLVLNTIRGGFYELDVMVLVSLAVSGFGFGMKFANLVAYLL